MNIKTYDDVILYSQTPSNFDNSEKYNEYESLLHLVGIFRTQYLFEFFGHKGNIYVLQDYNPQIWK